MGELEDKSFKLQADMDGLLVDYAKKGYTVEYLGEDDVEGTAVHQLQPGHPRGHGRRYVLRRRVLPAASSRPPR